MIKALYDASFFLPEDVPPAYHKESSVQWEVTLSEDGKFQNLQRLGKGETRLVPDMSRTSGVAPLFVSDKTLYVLPNRLQENLREHARLDSVGKAAPHDAYIALLEEGSAVDPSVAAVRSLLTSAEFVDAILSRDDVFKKSDFWTFRVQKSDGSFVFPSELPSVQNFWTEKQRAINSVVGSVTCLVTGSVITSCPRLHQKVKLPNTTVTSLISFNEDAFGGKTQGSNAPVSHEVHERYASAARFLFQKPYAYTDGDLMFVAWVTAGAKIHPLGWGPNRLPEIQPAANLRDALMSVWRNEGLPPQPDADVNFFVLGVHGHRPRILSKGQVAASALWDNLERWHKSLQISGGSKGLRPAPSVKKILDSLGKSAKDSYKVALLDSAYFGKKLPSGMMTAVLMQHGATPTHAAILRMLLHERGHTMSPELDPNHPSASYHFGRMLRLAETLQYTAMGTTNRTIKDRMSTVARNYPLRAYDEIFTKGNVYLEKIRRTKPGKFPSLSIEWSKVVGKVTPLGKTMTQEQRAEFILGIVHQDVAHWDAVAQNRLARTEVEANIEET